MSSRKLKIINFKRQYIDVDDDGEYTSFIGDMERDYLKLEGPNWTKTLESETSREKQVELVNEYITSRGYKPSSRLEAVNYVLDRVIEKIYDQNEEAHHLTSQKYRELKEQKVKSKQEENPFTNVDLSNPEVVSAIDDLCTTIGIAKHPDSLVRLKAACRFIQNNLEQSVIDKKNKLHKEGFTPKTFKLDDFPAGYPAGNESLTKAAKILRILNVNSLRDTQTLINETLVAIQNVTIDQSKKPDLGQVKYGVPSSKPF